MKTQTMFGHTINAYTISIHFSHVRWWSTSFHSIQVHIVMAFCEHFTLNTFLFQNWKTENQKDKIAQIKWRTLKASNMACSMDRFSKCTWLRQAYAIVRFCCAFFMKPFLILFTHIDLLTCFFFLSLTFRNFCYRFNYNEKQLLNVSPLCISVLVVLCSHAFRK